MSRTLYAYIFVIFTIGCQHKPIANNDSLNELIKAVEELNECKHQVKDEQEQILRKVIRNEIIPELNEIRLYSKKEIKKQRLSKGEALKRILIGRVEWIETEDGKAHFKARVDTGAQTNSLHAFNINEKRVEGKDYVEFETIDSDHKRITFFEKVVKKSIVKSTSGESEPRYVVEMKLKLGDRTIKSNVNLNNRANLKHKFLIGRNLLIGDYIVDVSQSRLLGGKK